MTPFKQDKMTERERLEALLNKQPVDRVPLRLFGAAFTARTVGYSITSIYESAEKSFEASVRTNEMYGGWHHVYSLIGGESLTRELGGEVKMPTSEYAMAPSVLRHPVDSEDDVWKLEFPDVRTSSATSEKLRFSELQKKNVFFITISCGGIITRVGNLTGVERMCRWMMKKPELVHRLCRLVADSEVAEAKYWVDTFGTPELMIAEGNTPTESNQILSPKLFQEFGLPYQKEVCEKILAMGVKHINFHICGEQNLNLPFWAQIPIGNPGLVSFGHEVDIETASEYFPNDIIIGNVNPTVIQEGTPEEVYELSRISIEKGKKHPGGFVLSTGCSLPPKAPPYNIWVMRKAINDFGWYE